MKKDINVLSVFDGIATGLVALKELGYTPNYYSSEIEESAIMVATKNHPEIIKLGDVTKVSYKDGYLNHTIYEYDDGENFQFEQGSHLTKIDLLIGGSPCNDLSQQHQVREGLKGKYSSLFYHFLRLKQETNPKYFLLENVKMSKKDEREITELLGVEPININSELVSAQRRERLYWTNIPNITQPEDKHILFQDIIESGFVNKEKSNCVTESMSRQVATPGGVRRYMMGFGTYVFESQDEYERIVGKTEKERIEYSKYMRSLPNSKSLIEHIHTPKARMITPNEAEMLQTLPKDYTYVEKLYYSTKGYNQRRGDSKRLSILGEGWTKDVIVHIFKNMEF
jgi:site-specific DNA-cytosine methylase